MGLFDTWKKQWDEAGRLTAEQLQKERLTDIEKGKVNKANDIARGIILSALEVGRKAGWTNQETLDKFNTALKNQPDKLEYDNKVIGAAGEIIGELTVTAPLATIGWFGSGGKIAQIYKQGLFGGAWEYLTNPTKVNQDRIDEALKTGAITAGATAVLGSVGRPLEKITNFDFKTNIQTTRDAANTLGVSPKLLGDFTGNQATRAAESLSNVRGGGAVERLKENVKELEAASGKIENMFTKGTVYSGEAGKNIVKAVQTNYKEATTEGNRLYGILDRVAEQNNLTKLNPTETRITLQNILSDYSDLFRTLERPALEAKLNAMSGKVSAQEIKQQAGMILDVSGKPFIPEIKGLMEFTFKDMRTTREALTDALQAAKNSNKLGSKEVTKISDVITAMDKDIDAWGNTVSHNSNVAGAWQKARDWWKGNVIPLRDADLAIALIKDPNSGELKTDISKLVGNIVSSETTGQEGAKRAATMIAKVLPEEVKQDVVAATFSTARKEATDAAGNFNPVKFSTFLQNRKQNLQPFVDDNIDAILNKFNYLSNRMSREAGSAFKASDEAVTTAGRVAVGSVMGGPAGAVVAAIPTNRLLEALSRNAFDTKTGRSIMLAAKSLDDLRPLITGGILSAPEQQQETTTTTDKVDKESSFVLPQELEQTIAETPKSSFVLPKELEQSQMDVNRQNIFNQELQESMKRSMEAQQTGNIQNQERAVGDISALLREAQRNNIPLSVR